MSDTPRKGSLLVIFLTVFIDLLGFGMVMPLLPIYANQFHVDEQGWQLGVLMASFSAMQFLFSPLWGRLSDRIGRRPVLMIGLSSSMVFYILFGVASVMESFALLLATRIGAGIAGATISTAQAYIADSTSLEKRPRGMALIGMAFGLGFTVGPLLGALAVQTEQDNPGPWPGWIAAALSGIALVLAIFWLPESRHEKSQSAARKVFDLQGFKEAMRTPSIGLLMFAVFVCIFSFANFETTLSLLLTGGERLETSPFAFSFRKLCLTYASIGLTLALVQGGLVRRLAGKIAEGKLAATGALIQAIGFCLFLLAVNRATEWLMWVAMPIVVLGFSFMQPNLNSLLSRRSDPTKQGMILGVNQSINSLARILGAFLSIPLLKFQLGLPYLVAAVLMAIGGFLVVLASRRGSDYSESPEAS